MTHNYAFDLCETMLDKGYISKPYDYLMEFHFFINFWKGLKTMELNEVNRFLKY
jgi:hypothetical protein